MLTDLIMFSVIAVVCSQPALADDSSPAPLTPSPKIPADLAKRIGDVTDAVLEHHIDPPTRQQMILGGIKALYKSAGLPVPAGLSQRVSALATPEQLAILLAEIWPGSTEKSVGATQLEQALLDGMLESVPGRARLISAKERKVEEQFKGNRYVGIHIALGFDDQEKRPKIHEVVEGGPADRAGCKPGDLIDFINGVDTEGMTVVDAVNRLRGDEGTDVTIMVRQPKQTKSRTMTITRGQLPHPTVQGVRRQAAGDWDVVLDPSTPIAYLRISKISASTPRELRKLARHLENQGNWGLVLDLRGLSGTSLHEAVLLADSLLGGGAIGRVQTAQREVTYQADADELFRTATIAVLVDRNTSGTAEWLAAALQDNHRAIIVGTPTLSATRAGAEWQTDARAMVTIGDGSWSMELTTGRLERADGRPIRGDVPITQTGGRAIRVKPPVAGEIKTGVKPDHVVGGNEGDPARLAPPGPRRRPNEEPSIANDEVLREAVRLLRESLAKFI
jgi:carboxyl-terminal processing protease